MKKDERQQKLNPGLLTSNAQPVLTYLKSFLLSSFGTILSIKTLASELGEYGGGKLIQLHSCMGTPAIQ